MASKKKVETPQQKFARENAENIWWMHIEGTGLYESEEMTSEFIQKIVDSKKHAKAIKKIMYEDILKDVTEWPDNFMRDENGNYTYDSTMYDYGFAIDDYCRKEFRKDMKKSLWLCDNCGSDDVEIMKWVNPNTNEVGVDCEADAYCNHCVGHHNISLVEMHIDAVVVPEEI